MPLLSPFIVLAVTFRAMDSLRIFDVIYTTTGGPNDATTNLQIMAYQYSFQWYQWAKAWPRPSSSSAGGDRQLPLMRLWVRAIVE